MKTPSFVSEHPWLTFFLGLAAVDGVVTIVRGYPKPGFGRAEQPRFESGGRGTYR